MKNKTTINTVTTLANITALVAAVAEQVLGNEVADTINGNPVTRDVIGDIALNQVQAHHNVNLGVI